MVFFVLLLCYADGNGIGAPETACNAMMPGHGYSAQTSAPPFRLVLSESDKLTGMQLNQDVSAMMSHRLFHFINLTHAHKN